MKKIAKQTAILTVIGCLALPLHAQDHDQAGSQNETKSGQREEQPGQPAISITKDGSLPLEQLSGKKVFVVFRNSGKLTEVLADRVAHLGGQVVQSSEGADVVLEGEGVFMAAREFGNRQARADVGEVFEKAGHVETKNKSLNIVLSHGGPVFSAAESMAILNFLDVVGEATGFKGWFNNLVAGDPDGFCFKGCEYRQGTTISLEMRGRDGARIGTASVTAGAEDRKLTPLPLIEAALGAMLSEFGGRSQQTDAGTTANSQ
ncbi:hypothetical protein [Pelomicrobium methylotrophicum]|uniref:Uncharacterized protein n=1 Tax=Pelomicrobium methylotrophicum TaxID=2602750 RepID=A0A5C7EYQ4_9PROT|nr:hypothetical protein [Pelomicrobium methylotrophicum]TXF13561.1 hypothetical protein FR698_00070 [Pelomicrobium methylotrophicum]